jgi:hypothetical protein
VKSRFSPCGAYLHIASLEAQLEELDADTKRAARRKSKSAPAAAAPRPSLRLSLLLATYRLSASKPARAPPALIHRAKLELGARAALAVSRLPFTFSWAARDLYLAESAADLRVHRVALFRPDEPADSVRVPQQAVFLPDTAASREVHFVPPAGGGAHSSVIVGAETRARAVAFAPEADLRPAAADDAADGEGERVGAGAAQLALPVGCVLREEHDLGGWVRAEDIAVRAPRGGTLERRREKFDPTDDCDGACSLCVSVGGRWLICVACSRAIPAVLLSVCEGGMRWEVKSRSCVSL